MNVAPPALLVASMSAEVERSIAAEIADKPSPETRRSYEHVWRFYRAWLAAQQPPLHCPKCNHHNPTMCVMAGQVKGLKAVAKTLTTERDELLGAVQMLTNQTHLPAEMRSPVYKVHLDSGKGRR